MLTQADVAKDYTLDADGCIKDLGKFEREHWSTVAMYDLVMNGFSDEPLQWSEDESEDLFILDDELRAAINAGKSDYAFSLYHCGNGFVYGQTIDKATYDHRMDEYEKQLEDAGE